MRPNESVDIMNGHAPAVFVKDVRMAWGMEQPSVHFFIKAAGQSKFLGRARHVAETWGRNATDATHMTFLFDNVNKEEVDSFDRDHPWVTVRHVDGTDQQGAYKYGDVNLRLAAYKAQRTKTRAVFLEFELSAQKPSWLCYLDDDMMVHIPYLQLDLLEKSLVCSPDCLVGDGRKH